MAVKQGRDCEAIDQFIYTYIDLFWNLIFVVQTEYVTTTTTTTV